MNSPSTLLSIDQIVEEYKTLQDEICRGLEELDGTGAFEQDLWDREEGGGGRTRLIRNGALIEKGGVNFSHVHGPLPEKIANKLGFDPQTEFHATGVSIVLHPKSPHVPIIHMNVRHFKIEGGAWWFGGGIDLTPIYFIRKDAITFHQALKDLCDQFNPDWYAEFKAWCDSYFFLKHRNETRGVSGVFYDRMNESRGAMTDLQRFNMGLGRLFVPVYSKIASQYKDLEWSEAEKDFQSLRRSRYVEFNLLFDAGTKFGIDSGGRTESILMSMPPIARWEYDYHPEPGTREAETIENLKPQNWLGL